MTSTVRGVGVQDRYLPEELFLPTHRCPNLLGLPSWKLILALVAMKHGCLQREILSDTKVRYVVKARHEAMALIYRHTQASMPMVGRWLHRDHTTVLHALKKHGSTKKLVERYVPVNPTRPLKLSTVKAVKPKRPARTPLQNAVSRAYRNQIPPSVLAEEYGCNPRSVAVLAHRMGLRRADFRPKTKHDWAAP